MVRGKGRQLLLGPPSRKGYSQGLAQPVTSRPSCEVCPTAWRRLDSLLPLLSLQSGDSSHLPPHANLAPLLRPSTCLRPTGMPSAQQRAELLTLVTRDS